MLKEIKNIIQYNLKEFVLFELFYKVITLAIFSPLFLELFNLIMRITGFTYLTKENTLEFILNPLTILLIIFLLILMTIYNLFDICTIIIMIDTSYKRKKVKIKDVIALSLRKASGVFQSKNIMLIFLVMFLIPLLNFGVTSSFMSSIKLPEYILDYISNNIWLIVLFVIIHFSLFYLLLRWMYTLHYYILEDCNFAQSRKRSKELSKKNYIKDIFNIVLTQVLLTIIYLLFIALGILVIFVLYYLLNNMIINTIIISIIWMFIAISFILVVLLSTPISYTIVSILFYKRKKEKKEKIKHVNLESKEIKKIQPKTWKIVWIVLIVLGTLGASFYTNGVMTGKYNLNIEYIKEMEITAHRGDSINYPENTMSAFMGAMNSGTDWIELDVQLTKDGEIVVFHDSNLKRIANKNVTISELTMDDIKDIDIGSSFNKEYSFERIPMLLDVIKWAKSNNVRLNIELKNGNKKNKLEEKVIDLLKENRYLDMCVITSPYYEEIERIKEYDSNIKTVYVMMFAYGNITKLNKADVFSIEASSVTESLVSKIHKEGKEIYVWTVNTEDNMNRMIDMNVDNIITDNVSLAKKTINNSKTTNVINEYIKLVEDLF